jgi:hypothetical protein
MQDMIDQYKKAKEAWDEFRAAILSAQDNATEEGKGALTKLMDRSRRVADVIDDVGMDVEDIEDATDMGLMEYHVSKWRCI